MRIGPQWSEAFDPTFAQLLHPAAAFDHPRNVVDDPDLTIEEKRAILSSWASDACAVESQPTLRQAPGSKHSVSFDEVVDALQSLGRKPPARWQRVIQKNKTRRQIDGDGGVPLT